MEEGPNKHATIKSLANWAVKEFTAMEKFKTDKRMLDIWKLMVQFLILHLDKLDKFRENIAKTWAWMECWKIFTELASLKIVLNFI